MEPINRIYELEWPSEMWGFRGESESLTSCSASAGLRGLAVHVDPALQAHQVTSLVFDLELASQHNAADFLERDLKGAEIIDVFRDFASQTGVERLAVRCVTQFRSKIREAPGQGLQITLADRCGSNR